MNFEIELTEVAVEDIERLKISGDKKTLLKIDKLLNELRVHPESGTGKPEMLKHYSIPTWSRRINDRHRLVYRIESEKIVVLVLSFWGHYGNK